MPDCSQLFIGLEDVISNVFIPSITGFGVMPVDRLLFSLPVRMGGLNINNPSETYIVFEILTYLTRSYGVFSRLYKRIGML